jgi:hypothetical protein
MFYLKNFYSNVKLHPVSGLVFILLIALWGSMFIFQDEINRKILKITEVKSMGPYFHALVDSKVNLPRIIRKLNDLPGIESIQTVPKEEVAKKLKTVLASIDLQEEVNSSSFSYNSLKVTFLKNLRVKSQTLIRDYIVRLAGDDNISLSAVKGESEENKSILKLKKILVKWSMPLGVMAFLSIFFPCLILFNSELRASSYLVENYQRRSFVALKTQIFSMLLFFTLILILDIVLNEFSPLKIGVMALPFLLAPSLNLKKYVWH